MKDDDTIMEIVASLEARVVRLEKRYGVKAAPAPWSPRPGTGIYSLLLAVVQRGGIWNPDRALDALMGSGWDSEAERPESVAGQYLRKLTNEGYLTHSSRGRYRYTGKELPATMLHSS